MLTFVETELFTRLVRHYFTDDEYAELQGHLASNPEVGSVIRGSGGVRKLRWRMPGGGKRGGLRVIYFLRLREGQIWMLTMYAKSDTASVPAEVLRKIKEAIDGQD